MKIPHNRALTALKIKHANVVCLNDPLSLCETMRSKDANKWEVTMQEEHNSLMANGTWELIILPKNYKNVIYK